MDYSKMEILVFLLAFSHVNLVLTDEKVDLTVPRQNTYKVHPEPEDSSAQNDQVAESSQTFGQSVVGPNQKETQQETQNHIRIAADGHQIPQQQVHITEGLSHGTINNVEVHQPVYVHQFPLQPIRILDAEASPLHQVHGTENQKTLGYSSYVEHVSPNDEEEIHSALKEGSVSDIKRLVPKSGISFKIYKNEKNQENHKPEIQQVAHIQQKIPTGYSTLHHKINTEVPTINIQTTHQQHTTSGLEDLQLKTKQLKIVTTEEQQHGLENSQHLLQSVGKIQQQQNIFYPQPEVPKTHLEIKTPNFPTAHYKLNLDDGSYSKGTTTEFNSLTSAKSSKHLHPGLNNLQNHKQWRYDSKIEGSQKAIKTLKPVATLQYELDPVAHAERIRGVHFTQPHTVSTVGHTNFNKQTSFVDKNIKNSNLHAVKATAFAGHLANRGHTEQKNTLLLNHGESVKTGHNLVGHLGAVYGGSQTIKTTQQDHFAYADNEAAKTGQHDLISHVAQNSYIETKGSQNNFDHQKALEGSTSFDIKNAIDNTGSLVHQTHYITPTTEIHPVEDIQKQQLAYIKLPPSTVLIDNSIHETPVVEGHQIKDFEVASPQISYHTSGVSGKYIHQPQTIVWTSDHPKQLTTNDFHHSLIKLHLPKEEFYQHVKIPNVELPTSSISHISYSQQKQPYVFHYDVPVLKYPQEIHFQPKTKTRIQTHQPGHIKLTQPVTIDWSLFKSSLPNIHSVAVKPELMTHVQETGKKIVPILVRKRKNRSHSKQEVGVIYGKVNNNRRPTKPSQRQEKNVRVNLLPEASTAVKQFEPKGDRKNEFSVSASYKVDRSFKSPNGS